MRSLGFVAMVVILGLVVAGCGTDQGMNSSQLSPVLRTVPAAEESNYDPTAPIHIKFSTAMDTTRFHDVFYLLDAVTHDAMYDSMGMEMLDSLMAVCDSMNRWMGGGQMGEMGRGGMMGNTDMGMHNMMNGDMHMGDTSGFYGRMHERGVRGQFNWNDDRDSCVFMPNSIMMGDRNYVMMMRGMGGKMRDGQGGMMSDAAENLTIRFHTRR